MVNVVYFTFYLIAFFTVENGSLIPVESRFLLTTNSSFVPSASTAAASELEVNNHVKERYFERPEVLKAFKEQQLIETPDFIKLGEVYSVGGRFRPRGSDDVRQSSFTAYNIRADILNQFCPVPLSFHHCFAAGRCGYL
jgi:hypothetical protein